MRIVVTGGAGFLGSHLCDELLKWGHSVFVIDNLSTGLYENIPKGVSNFYKVDLRNKQLVNFVIKIAKPEILYNLSAWAHEGLSQFCPNLILENNLNASMNLLVAGIKVGVKRFIFTSCHDEQTRLFTKNGFKTWDKINKDDIIFTLNNETGILEEKPIISIKKYDYDGEMIGVKGRRVDQLVTPNHRVLYLNSLKKHPKIAYEDADIFIERSVATIPISKGWEGKDFKEYYVFPKVKNLWKLKKEPERIKMKDLFYLIGLFVADGVASEKKSKHISKTGFKREIYISIRNRMGQFIKSKKVGKEEFSYGTTYLIRFCVPKNDKARKRLEEILETNGYKFSSYKNGDDSEGIVAITSQNLFNIFHKCGSTAEEKHFPQWVFSAKKELLEELFNGCMDGDGNKIRSNLTTISEKLVRDMIEIGLKIGKGVSVGNTKASVSVIKGRKINSRPSFYVYVSRTNQFLTKDNFFKKKYKGKVWCLEVENGNFLIERNNKLCFSGNSMSVYGDQIPPFTEEMPRRPCDVYGVTKVAFENTLEIMSKVYGFEYVIIRPHNVIGSRQALHDPYRNVVAIFMNRLLQDKPFYIYGDGKQKRAFSFVDDFTPVLAKVGFDDKAKNQIFNIGADKAYSINEMADMLLHISNSKIKPIHVADRPQEVKFAWCNNDKAKKILGFEDKTSLYEGLKKTWEWVKPKGPVTPKYLPYLELTQGAPETWMKRLI